MVRIIGAPKIEVLLESALKLRSAKSGTGKDWRTVRDQLTEAFMRFAKTTRHRSFDTTLRRWVKERLKSNFFVDYIDPEARVPSRAFISHLEERFRVGR